MARGRPKRDKEREDREAAAVIQGWRDQAKRLDQEHATMEDLMGQSRSYVLSRSKRKPEA